MECLLPSLEKMTDNLNQILCSLVLNRQTIMRCSVSSDVENKNKDITYSAKKQQIARTTTTTFISNDLS
ncbi:hypothetical protein PanWU01x14_257060 [Parasponia andersonii]|uniref:Uncharacterized protein n=1 Tax=Parasponia andersonii TaxID=3476 RepID=A0A2P5BA95_PARAD|nr:hypothetical protein PanWU01x14_257060 [Parasponia andersonii]